MSSYEVIKIVYLYIESFLNKKTEKVNFNVHFYKKIYNYFVYDDWIIWVFLHLMVKMYNSKNNYSKKYSGIVSKLGEIQNWFKEEEEEEQSRSIAIC